MEARQRRSQASGQARHDLSRTRNPVLPRIHRKGCRIVCEDVAAALALWHRLGALGRAALPRRPPDAGLLFRTFLARTGRERQTGPSARFREYRDWPHLLVERFASTFSIGRILPEPGLACATAPPSNRRAQPCRLN